jgi:hypothetical protein
VAGAIAEIRHLQGAQRRLGILTSRRTTSAVVAQGFRWLMPRPERSNGTLATARKLSGR